MMLRAAAVTARVVRADAQNVPLAQFAWRSFATTPSGKNAPPKRAPPKRQECVKPAPGAPVHPKATPNTAAAAAAATPSASSSSSQARSSSSSIPSSSGGSSSDPNFAAGMQDAINDPSMSSMFNNPAMRARMSDPNMMAQMQSVLSDPAKLAQMERMMANPLVRKGLAAMNPEIAAQLNDPVARAEMMKQAQELAKNPQQLSALQQAMQSKAQAATAAETPKSQPPAAPKSTSASKAPKPEAVAATAAAAQPTAASLPFAPMDPALLAKLSDPSMRARLTALLSNPTQLDSLLADPLSRSMLAKAAGASSGPAAEQLLKAMENKEARKQLIDTLQQMGKPGGAIDAAINKAAEATTTTAAHAAPASATAAATRTAEPVSMTGGGGGGAGVPPPPPSSLEEDPDMLAPVASGPRTLGWWVDLLLGLAAGYLLFEALRFVLDRPVVLDGVIEAAEEDELFRLKVGAPAKLPFYRIWTGNVEEGASAAVVIPVTGPAGSGTLHARALWDAYSKSWKLMLLQLADIDGPESAQKHSLIIPDRFVIKPRYVSPEEAERIRKKYEDMQEKMAQIHGNAEGKGTPLPHQPTGQDKLAPPAFPKQ